jgi:hypothetical protein
MMTFASIKINLAPWRRVSIIFVQYPNKLLIGKPCIVSTKMIKLDKKRRHLCFCNGKFEEKKSINMINEIDIDLLFISKSYTCIYEKYQINGNKCPVA